MAQSAISYLIFGDFLNILSPNLKCKGHCTRMQKLCIVNLNNYVKKEAEELNQYLLYYECSLQLIESKVCRPHSLPIFCFFPTGICFERKCSSLSAQEHNVFHFNKTFNLLLSLVNVRMLWCA